MNLKTFFLLGGIAFFTLSCGDSKTSNGNDEADKGDSTIEILDTAKLEATVDSLTKKVDASVVQLDEDIKTVDSLLEDL